MSASRCALVLLALPLVSCAAREGRIRDTFLATYTCTEEEVQVSRNAGGDYKASGCGTSMDYTCTDTDICYARRQLPAVTLSDVSGDGKLFFSAAFETEALFKVHAWPSEDGRAEAELATTLGEACGLELLADGQPLKLEVLQQKSSLRLPIEVVRGFAKVSRLTLRACKREWSLSAEQLAELHRFASQYEQGLPKREAAATSSPGHEPPVGGWPSWKGLGNFPNAADAGQVLSGPDLYEKLAPVVLRIEAQLAAGVSQGSAVAISPTQALTNCHVVEGATKIVVKQRGAEWTARLKESDPGRDRCILEASAAAFTPVTAVRPYAALRVGETLYTLGAPSGLDLTLANGILSARREDEGVRYVQTTAPISPGSSGGGLFDAYGNLVGITTMVLIGKENHNQSLNFAIAAEMFWSP